MLQHAAAYEVNHLGRILLEDCKEPLMFKYMPHAVFTDPKIASVGLSEQEAKKKRDRVCNKHYKIGLQVLKRCQQGLNIHGRNF